jgi:hypothetical protein
MCNYVAILFATMIYGVFFIYDTEAFVILLVDLLLFGNWNSKASSIHILLIISQLHDHIRKIDHRDLTRKV